MLKRFTAFALATACVTTGSLAQPAVAMASSLSGSGTTATVSSFGNLSSGSNFEQLFKNLDAGARDAAWQLRNSLHAAANAIADPTARQNVKNAIDTAANAIFPGLTAARNPAPEPAPAPAPEVAAPAPASNPVANTPCPPSARICVDLAGNRTWLQKNGHLEYGPVQMSHGAPSARTATPKGTFPINRKIKNEISYEFNNAPMPYAMYFTHNGHAFHQGTYLPSHGCIRLAAQDAAYYFGHVNIGDQVFIY